MISFAYLSDERLTPHNPCVGLIRSREMELWQGQVISCLKTSREETSHRKTGNAASVNVCLSPPYCELGHQLLRKVDIRPEVLGQSTRGTAATHPTIQGNATTARELGESR